MTHLIREGLHSWQTWQPGGPGLIWCFHHCLNFTGSLTLLTCAEAPVVPVQSYVWTVLCVQGLANESSNHSYGSLGSSSDKESEVRKKKKTMHPILIVQLIHSSLFFGQNLVALSLPLLPPFPTFVFLELRSEKRELPCLLSMYLLPTALSCWTQASLSALLGNTRDLCVFFHSSPFILIHRPQRRSTLNRPGGGRGKRTPILRVVKVCLAMQQDTGKMSTSCSVIINISLIFKGKTSTRGPKISDYFDVSSDRFTFVMVLNWN